MNRKQRKERLNRLNAMYAETAGQKVARLEKEKARIIMQQMELEKAQKEAWRRQQVMLKWNERKARIEKIQQNKPKTLSEV